MSRSKPTGKGSGSKKEPIPIRGSRHKFGSSRAHGLQVEYQFRRQYPLSEGATSELHRAVAEIVRQNRRSYSRFFVSLLMKVLGGLYQLKFIRTEDDEAQWEEQWVSTPVVKRIADLQRELDNLLDETIDFQVGKRPAKLLRFRVVFLSNKE